MVDLTKKAPPNSKELEQQVLGAIVLKPAIMDEIASRLQAEDFYWQAHQLIYQAMKDLMTANQPIDLVMLSEQLESSGNLQKVGGSLYLASLTDLIAAPSGVVQWAEQLKEYSRRRVLIQKSIELQEKAFDLTANVDEFAADLHEVADTVMQDRVNVSAQRPDVLVERFLDYTERLCSEVGRGIPTPIYGLNAKIGGLRGGEITVVGARPGCGKTALALNMFHYAVKKRHPAAFISLEMTAESLFSRMVAAEKQVDAQKFRMGSFKDEDIEKIKEWADFFRNCPARIYDCPSMTPLEFRSQARKWVREFGCEVIFLDYLQLMQPDRKHPSREREIAEASRTIKETALELNIPIVINSQVNREAEKTHKVLLSHLRESGSLEQDADIVVFLPVWTKKLDVAGVDNVEMELDVAKGRSNAVGSVSVIYRRRYLRFVNPINMQEEE